MNIKISNLLFFFFIFFLGSFLRFHNNSYDDLWYDEVISFWIANPKFSLYESFLNHNLIEVNTFTYHFFLKIIFKYFGYSVEVGRLLSVIISSLSILSVTYLVYYISKNKSYLFASFLISFNIFLISFSQEMRLYSFLFFIVSISIIFFLRSIETGKKSDLTFFFISTSLAISLHAFALIILFSYIVSLFFQYLKKNKFFYLNLNVTIILIISLILYYYSFLNATSDNSSEYFWMANPDLKFFTNFYFSSFFGSRLMGALFLIIFLSLTFYNIKKKTNSISFNLFLIILALSYLLPIVFGYLFKPILVNRYIIFVLIPITAIIATVTFDLNKKKSFLIIFILTAATLGNHLTEQTFKQFFNSRIVSKPQYKSAILHINNSDYKDYSLRVEKMKNNEASMKAINNYIYHLNKKLGTNVKFISPSNNLKGKILWQICFQDINGKNCSVNKKIKNFITLKEENFNNINIKLIKIL